MKIYKVLHIPTGMYFRPSKYPSHHNLSRTGKVYHAKPNIKSWLHTYPTGYAYNHPVKDYPYYEVRRCNLEDWKIIEGSI